MQILTETFGDVLVAHAPDDLTDDAAQLLANTVGRSADAGQVKVVLQMDRSDGFDSAGLTALRDLHDRLREAGGGLKFCGLTETGRRTADGDQPRYYQEILATLRAELWVSRLFFFHYWDGPGQGNGGFGIVNEDFSPKPAYFVLQTATTMSSIGVTT